MVKMNKTFQVRLVPMLLFLIFSWWGIAMWVWYVSKPYRQTTRYFSDSMIRVSEIVVDAANRCKENETLFNQLTEKDELVKKLMKKNKRFVIDVGNETMSVKELQ